MKLTALLLVLGLATATATGAGRTLQSIYGKANYVCPDAGYYAAGTCSANFYNCARKGDTPPYTVCPDGLVWNQAITTCDHPQDVPECGIEGNCKGKGLFPVTKKACSGFFLNCPSKGAEGTIEPCPADLYYDKTSKTCEEYEDVPACCDPICKNGPGIFPVEGNPTKYDTCSAECAKHVRMTCPEGTTFKPKKKKCTRNPL